MCIGFTNTSACPYPVSANFFSFEIFPSDENVDFFKLSGNSICSLKPMLFRLEHIVSAPICIAACAKKILSECINAFFIFFGPLYCVKVVIKTFPQLALFCQLKPEYENVVSFVIFPELSPIAAVIGLNVEPGA